MSETPQEWFSRKVEEYKDDPEYLRELVKIEHGEVLARDARIAELEAALRPFALGDLRQYQKLPDDTVLILCVSGMERRPDIAEARWLRLGDLRRCCPERRR